MTQITLVRGDKNYVLDFTIYDMDGEKVNLVGSSTIILKLKSYANGTLTQIIGQVVDPPSNGEVRFPVVEEFLSAVGEFKAEIEIAYAGGKVITAPNISVKIIADLV